MEFIKDLSIDSIRNLAEDAYNQAKPKTDLEKKIYEVLSHKNWGSSSTLLNEVAQYTYDMDKFPVVTKMMWESMDNRPAAWRIVFKALTLLEHLIKNGSERCVDDARGHQHQLRNLENFNYYEGTVDRGIGVREKSKQVMELLADDERIREERAKAKQLREKFGGMTFSSPNPNNTYGGSGGGGGGSSYPGYGNDSDFNSGGGYNNGGGYGNSGIGSRFNDGGGFSGRYSDQDSSSNLSKNTPAPTFASIPDETEEKATKKTTKAKKLKKKKKKAPEPEEAEPPAPAPISAPPAPAVDLFAFDDAPAATTTSASADNDEFGAFDSAAASVPAANEDTFDAFASAPTSTPAANDVAFDAFSGAATTPQKPTAPVPTSNVDAFDAFSNISSNQGGNQMGMNQMNMMQQQNAMNMMQQQNVMNMMQQQNQMNMMQQQNPMNMMQQQNQMNMMQQQMQMMNAMGGGNVQGMNMMQGSGGAGSSNVMGGGKSGNIMGGGVMSKNNSKKNVTKPETNDDDFGDFSGADNNVNANIDPINKLISLDSLTLNKPKEDKTKQPIIYNQAAATAYQTKSSMGSTVNPALSFSGIDGLNKQVDISVKTPVSNRQPGQPIMAPANNIGMQGSMGMGMGMNVQQQGMAGGAMQGNMGMRMGMNTQQQGMMGNNMMGGQMGASQMNNMMGNQMNMSGNNTMMGNMGAMNGQPMSGNNMMGNMGGNGMNGQSMNNMGGMMGGQPMNGWQ